MHKRTRTLGALVAVLTACPIASAQEPPAVPSTPLGAAPAPAPKVWYGYETLTVDGVSALLGIVGGVVNAATGTSQVGSAIGGVGVVGYVLGAPIVHWVHGRVETGLGDLGIRFFAPGAGALVGLIAGTIIGSQSRNCNNDGDLGNCGTGLGLIFGAAAGAVAAVAIDAAVLAWETTTPSPAETGRSDAPGFSIVPVVRVARGEEGRARAVVGVGGTF
jgi:hypothetical protein